jgi:hypothetical protein
MPVPAPEDPASRPTANAEGGGPPADSRLLKLLRGGLEILRFVAPIGPFRLEKKAGGSIELTNSTTDAELDHFLHEIGGATPTTAAEREAVQEKKEVVVMLPPFKFDPFGRILWSSNGIPSPSMPNRLAKPIEAMLQKDTMNPKRRVWQLDYVRVAELY